MKLKVLTSLKLNPLQNPDGASEALSRKVKTVQQIPKIFSIVNQKSRDFSPKGSKYLDEKEGGIGVIAEEDPSKHDSSSEGGESGSGSDDDSSIDGDFEKDEMLMYEQIMAA